MTVDQAYFEDMYAGSDDPWSFETRWYEQRKRTMTLAALSRPSYRSAYEPGCAIGVLSELLAPRCDALLCTDAVPAAVAHASARLAVYSHVRVAEQRVPDDWPAGPFDLIVLSEILYYFPEETLARILDLVIGSLEPGGELVTVHWRPRVPEHLLCGDDVAAALESTPGLALTGRYQDLDLILATYQRTPPVARSVAQREDLRA